MRDKYSYTPGPVPAAAPPAGARLAVVHQFVIDFFTGRKVTRKAAATAAVTQLQGALAAGPINTVPAFRAYEAAHLAIGNLPQHQLEAVLRQDVQAAYSSQYPHGWPPLLNPRVNLRLVPVPATNHVFDVQVLVREPPTAAPVHATVGRVYAGDVRFDIQPIGLQPPNRANDVYTRRGFPNQHYIRYQRGGTGRYLRRYVIRGLNQEDSARITGAQGLTAPELNNTATDNEIRDQNYTGKHHVILGAALNEHQQILSHTRGWKKRFISTTTTMRPAYSTRGVEFRSVFGKVIIDLAFVAGASIFDLHGPDALTVLNTNAAQIQAAAHQPNPAARALHDEEILAGRDVIRTREVLIRRTVPRVAIRSRAVGQTVIGIWHPGANLNGLATFGAVEAAWGIPVRFDASETLDYRRNDRWYRFYHFANANTALMAWNLIPIAQQGQREWFVEYDFPNPLPVGSPGNVLFGSSSRASKDENRPFYPKVGSNARYRRTKHRYNQTFDASPRARHAATLCRRVVRLFR
jgi:hypothetical protein